MKSINIKKAVRESYGKIAKQNSSCCGPSNSTSCGCKVPSSSKPGLGCGNPVAVASLKKGEVVLDLGSGPGLDCFLAAKKVGKSGKIIGVDMTPEMIDKARENAKKGKYKNVEFRKGDIENLPVEDNSIDVVISNCVINLAPQKEKVFKETHRVLRKGGRLMIADIVLTRPLPKEIKEDVKSLVGCVSGAILKDEYFKLLKRAGFNKIKIHNESLSFLEGRGLSITFSAFK